MNIFNSAKTIIQPREFEYIMRSLIMLVEYERTYPEAKKMLKEIRDGLFINIEYIPYIFLAIIFLYLSKIAVILIFLNKN